MATGTKAKKKPAKKAAPKARKVAPKAAKPKAKKGLLSRFFSK